MKSIKYIRVSSRDQNVDRQLSDLEYYIDYCSGSVKFEDRPFGKRIIQEVEKGLIAKIHVHSIDRLGRNTVDILTTIDFFNKKCVILYIENLGISNLLNGKVNEVFNLIISVLANVSEMERRTLLERQQEGIQKAIQKGIYKGRLKGTKESSEKFISKYPHVVKLLKKGNLSLQEIALITKVSKSTVFKVNKYLHI
jgi:DNA invertase Pin-like site-specific DNA recombinase